MTRWLTIVGIGEDGIEGLAPAARAALGEAEIIVGSARVLDRAEGLEAEIRIWAPNLDDTLDEIVSLEGARVCVLATGDPSNYGIARRLLRRVPIEETTILPAPSAFSLAAARLGWSLPDVTTLTLHGRPDALLEPAIAPGVRIIALTADATSVAKAALRLRARGFGKSRMHVLEHMGGPRERIVSFAAGEAVPHGIADFNTLAIECVAGPDAVLLPTTPGLPDEAFAHDGQLTKSEVRAATVTALAPYPDALLWDLGAGCGSVAIEWMRGARFARAIAFERQAPRIAMARENADRLGTPLLAVVEGELPATLARQPAPDAVFHGGDVSNEAVFAPAWKALRPGGRLVANAVTLEGEAALYARHAVHGGDLVRIDVSTLARIGGKRVMRPRMAVIQWRVTKPWDAAR